MCSYRYVCVDEDVDMCVVIDVDVDMYYSCRYVCVDEDVDINLDICV